MNFIAYGDKVKVDWLGLKLSRGPAMDLHKRVWDIPLDQAEQRVSDGTVVAEMSEASCTTNNCIMDVLSVVDNTS